MSIAVAASVAAIAVTEVTAAMTSIWGTSFPMFNIPDNTKTYLGFGQAEKWFHWSMGMRNTLARQVFAAFSDSCAEPVDFRLAGEPL